MRKLPFGLVASLTIFLFSLLGTFGCASKAKNPPASTETLGSPTEEKVKAFILARAVNPAGVQFLKWGPHVESEGFFRCRYRLKEGQDKAQVFDDWFIVHDGQISLNVHKARMNKQDRKELEKDLKEVFKSIPPEKLSTLE